MSQECLLIQNLSEYSLFPVNYFASASSLNIILLLWRVKNVLLEMILESVLLYQLTKTSHMLYMYNVSAHLSSRRIRPVFLAYITPFLWENYFAFGDISSSHLLCDSRCYSVLWETHLT